MGDKHSVSADAVSTSPPLSPVRRSVSPPTDLSLGARVNGGNASPYRVRKLASPRSPTVPMSPTQGHVKLSPASVRDDAKLSPTSSTQSMRSHDGSGAIGVSRKYLHRSDRSTAGACLARGTPTSDSIAVCQHVSDAMNGDAQKDSNAPTAKTPVSSPKALSPVVHIHNGASSHHAKFHIDIRDARNDTSPTSVSNSKTTPPSEAPGLAGRGSLGLAASNPFPVLPPPYRVTRTALSPTAPHRGHNSPTSPSNGDIAASQSGCVVQQPEIIVQRNHPVNGITNGLPVDPSDAPSFVSTAQCLPSSPVSSVAGSVASFSFDGAVAAPGGGRQKQTLGELLQQIDVVARALRSRGDFTRPDFLPDLLFLAHQSRYNSDAGVKRRIVARLVDAGILEIAIKIFWFLSSADYLGTVATATTTMADQNENGGIDESTESIPMLLALGDRRRGLTTSHGKTDSVDSEGQSVVSTADVVKIVHAVVTCLQHTTQRSAVLCEGCVRRGLVQMMLLELADPRLACHDPKEQVKVVVVKGFLSILTNVIRNYGDGRVAFRLAGALRVLQLHIKSPLLPVKIKTAILLAYVVTETENEIVNATDKNVGLVVRMLQTTVDTSCHYSRKYGFSASEAVAGKKHPLFKRVFPLYIHLETLIHLQLMSLSR